jgi:alkylhydroperoxidase family enzyme
LFDGRQRAALGYATELTEQREMSASTFSRLSHFYDERQMCEIVYVVASEHMFNINNIGLNIGSDGLCDGPVKG